MLSIKKTLVGMLAATVAAGAFAGTAQAQLNPDISDVATLGQVVAMPYLTSTSGPGERITVQVITNGLTTQAIGLHLFWISGDPDDSWGGFDRLCNLTPLETTYLVYERVGENARVTYECSDAGVFDGTDLARVNRIQNATVPGKDGILFAALECQANQAGCGGLADVRLLAANALLADWTIMDFAKGYAASAIAVHIQNGSGWDGDLVYKFDGNDLANIPAFLTTNYIAADDDITLEALLFTLDGALGDGPGIVARLFGFAYDDDENFQSATFEFDCFTVRDLTSVDEGFGDFVTRRGDNVVGHIQAVPVSTGAGDLVEFDPDLALGDAAGVRKRPIFAYIIQTIAETGDFDDGAFGTPKAEGGMAGNGAWMRIFVSGTTPLVPSGGDTPGFVGSGGFGA